MRGKIRCIIKVIIAIILIAIPLIVINYEKNSLSSQNTYLRWDNKGKSAHISAYMTDEVQFDMNRIYELEENIKNALLENNALNTKNGGRSWADCYSASGTVAIENGSADMEVQTIGVGGDFFLFHPLQLLSGSYFSSENIMQDLVVIDEDIAWRLFGSVNVSGMTLDINGKKHMISGVIKRDEGRLNKAAGNGKPILYMSYESLSSLNENVTITTYEVVMPNLTKDYARKLIKEKLDLSETECEIIDNTDRFSLVFLFKVIKEFDTRSMKTSKVCYPYWENVAQGKANICALWLMIEIIIVLAILLIVIKNGIRYYKKNRDMIQDRWKQLKERVKLFGGKCIGRILRRKNHVTEEELQTSTDYLATVIFDIGNVLVHFIPEEYLERKGYHGKQQKKLMDAVIENTVWNEYDRGVLTKAEVVAKYIKSTPYLKNDIQKLFNDLSGIIKRCEYTDRWIEELREKNVRVLFLSNISEALYQDCREELGFIEQMDGGLLSFEVKCIKPEQQIFEMMIETYHLEPDRCIFVDDRQVNIESGKQAGFNSILFTSYEETNDRINQVLEQWR